MQHYHAVRFALAIFLLPVLPVEAEEIVVGAQFPLSGPMAAYAGPNMRNAAEIAAKRINEKHLLGPDRTVKLIVEDDASDKTQAIELVSRLVLTEKAAVLLGPVVSPLALATAPVANDLKTPMMAITISDDVLAAGPWSFKIFMDSAKQLVPLAQYAADKLKIRKIALVFDRTNESYLAMKSALLSVFGPKGIVVVSEDTVAPQESNFAALTTKIVSEKVDAVFCDAPPPVQANFLIQLRQAGLAPDTKIFFDQQANSPVFLKIAGKAAEGIYHPTDYFAETPGEENASFVAEYRKRMNFVPDTFAAAAYNGMMLIGEAIRKAGPGADKAKIRDAMAGITNFSSIFGTGTYSIGAGRQPSYHMLLLNIADGKRHLVE